ncbi:Glutamate carboxypeptidase 2 [Bulinus truncatus]|nr:Glutamate carboxypeptidase 2 [Bulinus truncatus]
MCRGTRILTLDSDTEVEMNSSEELHSDGYYGRKDRRLPLNKVRLALILLLAAVIGLAIGLLVGKFALCDEEDREGVFLPGVPDRLVSDEDLDISDLIMKAIDPAKIESNLRDLTKHPHIAGRSRDFELVSYLQKHFKDNGLHVQTTPYDVLLSYPNEATPNSVRLVDGSGNILYDAKSNESDISGEPDVVPPFNAYSPSKLVEGELVFANYGRVEDFETLVNRSVNVTGRVVIVKYGKMFRGDKVDIAASYGATGIIIYSDPADYTGFKSGDYRVYPDTWWLPSTGVQRGTVFTGDGDPLTPGYPANNLAFRYTEDEVDPPLPKIPAHPIGYGAATEILKHLNGTPVPGWAGGLNVSYNTGPGFIRSDMKIQLNVTTKNQRAKAENVFGIIRGTVEPDRYVLIGNHRDAWIYGAIDPSSGTAVIMELVRVMGSLVKSGRWKPRRSIVFCSWGAEEFGLIGSTEWVEQYVATLRERAVVYINVDIAVYGNDTLKVSSTPLMHNIIYEASKKVPNPNPEEIKQGRKTVYDTWLNVTSSQDTNHLPIINIPASGSDFAPILQRAGITALDMSYIYDNKKYNIAFYALYHTEYEKFEIVKSQFDKHFLFHAAVAQLSGEMVRRVTDSLILPFNVSNYAAGLETLRKSLDKDHGTKLKEKLDNYNMLETVIRNFTEDVANFESRFKSINRNDPFSIRAVNDQIMLLERAFLEPEGLPGRPLKKHLIFAESDHDAYAGSSFPGLVDLLFQIDREPERWEKVKQHFSVILQTIQSAGAMLRDVTNFMSETL